MRWIVKDEALDKWMPLWIGKKSKIHIKTRFPLQNMMGTQALEPKQTTPVQPVSLRSRLKKLSSDLERATSQTFKLKTELQESERRNAVLKSVVTNLRSSSSQEPLAQNKSESEQITQLKSQLAALTEARDSERSRAQSLEMELFEAIELIEKEGLMVGLFLGN